MNVLGVFAHPDDEVLGAGGTLAKHAAAGDSVRLLGMVHRGLRREWDASRKTLGVQSHFLGSLRDQQLEMYPLSVLIELIDTWQTDPDIIYTHHPGDLNLDHAITARAVLTAFRPKPGEKPRTILACEVLSSTEWTFPQQFQPNWFEELGPDDVKRKERALTCYPTELRADPHPRSVVGIWTAAEYRGQQVGVDFAEAFQLLRRGPC